MKNKEQVSKDYMELLLSSAFWIKGGFCPSEREDFEQKGHGNRNKSVPQVHNFQMSFT